MISHQVYYAYGIYGNIFFPCNKLDQQDNYLIYMHKHVGSRKNSDIILIILFQKSQMQVICIVTIHFSSILPSNKDLKRLDANLMRKLVIMKYTHFYDIVITFYIFSFAVGIITFDITSPFQLARFHNLSNLIYLRQNKRCIDIIKHTD